MSSGLPIYNMKVVSFPDAESIAQAVADIVVQAAASAIASRDAFHLVLAGGNTPRLCYQLLRQAELDWNRIHIWFGDERCLPPGDAGRNDSMADAALLRYVPVPACQVHRIATEKGPEKGAAAYARLLAQAPRPDLALFGMGEDGHTASLFPDNPALNDQRLAVPVFDSPKPPSQRITMGFSALNRAERRIVLIAGESKRDAWNSICAGEQLPVAMLDDPECFVALH